MRSLIVRFWSDDGCQDRLVITILLLVAGVVIQGIGSQVGIIFARLKATMPAPQ